MRLVSMPVLHRLARKPREKCELNTDIYHWVMSALGLLREETRSVSLVGTAFLKQDLTPISQGLSAAAADPGLSYRSQVLLQLATCGLEQLYPRPLAPPSDETGREMQASR